jgi:hypothetical protein
MTIGVALAARTPKARKKTVAARTIFVMTERDSMRAEGCNGSAAASADKQGGGVDGSARRRQQRGQVVGREGDCRRNVDLSSTLVLTRAMFGHCRLDSDSRAMFD